MACHTAANAEHIYLKMDRSLRNAPFAIVERNAAATLTPDWRKLAGLAVADNPFFDPDFALPAIAAIGGAVRIAIWREAGGDVAALAPFTRSRLGRIAPAIRVWSHPYGPLGVPLVLAGEVARSVEGIVSGLLDRGVSLVIPEMAMDGPVAAAIVDFAARSGRPLAVVNRYQRALLELPVSGALDCRAGLSTRRRREYSRQMRRLHEQGLVKIEITGEVEEVGRQFEEFLALEASGWKGSQGTSLATNPEIAAMARRIVANQSAKGCVRINSIRLDGRPIAMLVSFLMGESAYSWKIAYDETYAGFSPGAQLMLEAGPMLLSIPGIRQIDSCATANHPMVDPLWPGRRKIGTLVVGPVGGGLLFQVGLAAMKGEIRGRSLVRQFLHRARNLRP